MLHADLRVTGYGLGSNIIAFVRGLVPPAPSIGFC